MRRRPLPSRGVRAAPRRGPASGGPSLCTRAAVLVAREASICPVKMQKSVGRTPCLGSLFALFQIRVAGTRGQLWVVGASELARDREDVPLP